MRQRLGAPLTPAAALALLTPLAGALDHLHAQGMAHGDLKPGNVLVPRPGQVLVIELGLAPLLARSNSIKMLDRGLHFGTLEYLAPEQRWGTPPTRQSDLYALGVILYEALAGRPPFRAEHAAEPPRLIMHRHVTMPPPPLARFNPGVPPMVEAVVLRALAKQPAE